MTEYIAVVVWNDGTVTTCQIKAMDSHEVYRKAWTIHDQVTDVIKKITVIRK